MRNVESISLAQQNAFFVQQIIAELFRVYVKVVMYEISRAVRFGVLMKIFLSFQPLVDYGAVFVYYLSVSLI